MRPEFPSRVYSIYLSDMKIVLHNAEVQVARSVGVPFGLLALLVHDALGVE